MHAWCTSGKDRNCCGGSCSHELTCCSDYNVAHANCYNAYGRYGEFIKCGNTGYVVVGACASGKNPDCSNKFLSKMYNETGIMPDEEILRGDGTYTIAYCCNSGLKLAPYGYWLTQGWGKTAECRPNQVITGLCSSGEDANCQPVPNSARGNMRDEYD